MLNTESSLTGVVTGPLEVRWDTETEGCVTIPTLVRERKLMIEAPLRRVQVGEGALLIGVGVNHLDTDQGVCLRAHGQLSAQPIRVVAQRIERLRHADTTRSGLFVVGVLRMYDKFGVGRVDLDDGTTVKVEMPMGVTVGVGERIYARGFPAKQPNTLRLVDVEIAPARD